MREKASPPFGSALIDSLPPEQTWESNFGCDTGLESWEGETLVEVIPARLY
jgi:hypothetical protein